MMNCRKWLSMVPAFAIIVTVSAADPTPSSANSKQLGNAKPSVKNVAASLRSLLLPSNYAEQLKNQRFDVKPSFKIVKGTDGKASLIYRCRFTQAKSLVNAMESMVSAQGMVEESAEQNLIVICDRAEKMDELKNALIAMDSNSPQVLVEAKVVEVMFADGMERDLSLTWNQYDARQNLTSKAGTSSVVPNQPAADAGQGANADWYPVVSGGIGDSSYSNFQTSMQWLLKADEAKILSAPNVVVSRNCTASIVTGSDIPIQTIQVVSGSTTTSTDFKRIGVILNVTPSLINDDYVSLKVNPQVSNVQRYENIKQGETNYPVPVISIRNIETNLTLRDGQIIMLGGLYSSRDVIAQNQVPFINDIPWLGDLFGGKNVSKEVTQLIFFLKVTILTPEELTEGIIYDPGKQAEEMRKAGQLIQNSQNIFPSRSDSVEDRIKGVMRYEDADGNYDLIGNRTDKLQFNAEDKKKTAPPPAPVPSNKNKPTADGKTVTSINMTATVPADTGTTPAKKSSSEAEVKTTATPQNTKAADKYAW